MFFFSRSTSFSWILSLWLSTIKQFEGGFKRLMVKIKHKNVFRECLINKRRLDNDIVIELDERRIAARILHMFYGHDACTISSFI